MTEPKFKREQQVKFAATIEGGTKTIEGVVYIVDANGTSEQHEEPSYDIEAFYEGEVILFKHIRESLVEAR